MTKEKFEKMNQVLVKTTMFLQEKGVTPYLSGSFAICGYAAKPVGDPQDIDFLFQSRDECDRAIELLEGQRSFERVSQTKWESDKGDESVNTKLRSPEGVDFDLAYAMGDIELTLDPDCTIHVDGCFVPVLSLSDIRKSYHRFFDEKPDSVDKIAYVDQLMRG